MNIRRFAPALAACLLVIATLSGCAGTRGKLITDQDEARGLWNVFQSQSRKASGAFSLSSSLTVTSPQKSSRVVLNFWGELDRPLRLDISTSMGQIYARWREDSSGWTGVYPMSRVAFTHSDTRKALAKLGLPLPFTLRDFAALAIGRFDALIPATYTQVKRTPEGYQYSLPPSSPIASVTLDNLANPVHLTGRGVEPWKVDLSDYSHTVTDRRSMADKIRLTTSGGVTVFLRIKKLELFANRSSLPTLELTEPPQTRTIPLDTDQDVQAPAMP
ncbi:hypothetical protein JCM15519_32680 [Fundidesulfovibrio butyratiphilus]